MTEEKELIPLNRDEFFLISRELEKFHSVFYKFWEMGTPVITDEIDTLAVRFNEEGNFTELLINRKFWSACSLYEKVFFICHEAIHVLLNHGIRTVDSENKDFCNYSLDVVANHSLIGNFGFDREKITNWEKFCWIDTVFKNRKDILKSQTFEYYYNKMKENCDSSLSSSVKLVDNHDGLKGKLSRELIEHIKKTSHQAEINNLKEFIQNNYECAKNSQAGTSIGGLWDFLSIGKVAKKKKWETVIKKWAMTQIKMTTKETEQWARINRRFVTVSRKMIIPTEMETEEIGEEEEKIKVWFFQDTSSSCWDFRQRFFKAAKSLPQNRFDIKLHCFDTQVYETTLESNRIYGGGGTSFSCIANYIENEIKNNIKKYPTVFIISDGFSNLFNCSRPEMWNWFLTNNYTKAIPVGSKIYQLKEYE